MTYFLVYEESDVCVRLACLTHTCTCTSHETRRETLRDAGREGSKGKGEGAREGNGEKTILPVFSHVCT